MNFLLACYGPVIIPMFVNFPYYYMLLSLCTWKIELLHEAKAKQTKQAPRELNSNRSSSFCDTSLIVSSTVNIIFCLLTAWLLLTLCGDVHPNPGPMKFCHLNARSVLAGVDLDLHMDDQHSLLDDIYECLVYINGFDVIAISETWLKDNVRDDALDLAGAIHRTDLEKNDTEVLWVELRLKDKRVLFATCYRPPGATALQVDYFIDSLSNQVECAMNENPDALIMVGDFNDRCTHWDDRHERSEMGLKFYNYLREAGGV